MCPSSHLHADQLAAEELGRHLRDRGLSLRQDLHEHDRKTERQSGRNQGTSCHSLVQASGTNAIES